MRRHQKGEPAGRGGQFAAEQPAAPHNSYGLTLGDSSRAAAQAVLSKVLIAIGDGCRLSEIPDLIARESFLALPGPDYTNSDRQRLRSAIEDAIDDVHDLGAGHRRSRFDLKDWFADAHPMEAEIAIASALGRF